MTLRTAAATQTLPSGGREDGERLGRVHAEEVGRTDRWREEEVVVPSRRSTLGAFIHLLSG